MSRSQRLDDLISRMISRVEQEELKLSAMAAALDNVGSDDVYDESARGQSLAYRDSACRLQYILSDFDVWVDE